VSGSWERVCRVEEAVGDRPVGKVVDESGPDPERVCVVALDDGGYAALLDRCPHRDIPLSGGIVKDGTLVCPGHFWRFDVRTGQRTDLPEQGATVYPTRVVDGWVEALLPPAKPRPPMREWLLAQARGERPAPQEDTSRQHGGQQPVGVRAGGT
jgi:nitrite reductase/ring-hydroxylating ferredoxin subunit